MAGPTIPQDIMTKAITVADEEVNFGSYEVNALAIARAILAERERCASIVQSGKGWIHDFRHRRGTMSDLIVTAIRSGK